MHSGTISADTAPARHAALYGPHGETDCPTISLASRSGREWSWVLSIKYWARKQVLKSLDQAGAFGGGDRTISAMLAAVPRYEFDSITPGTANWSERWKHASRRVVFFAPNDYAGSLFQIARAINSSSEWAARLISIHPHQYGYENDLLYGHPKNVPQGLHDLLSQADVIHVKDESGFLDGTNRLPPDLLARHDKPVVFQLYGSVSRERQESQRFRAYVNGHAGVVSLTPDLCFKWLKRPRFIPHAVHSDEINLTWVDGNRLAHSPSDPRKKGTKNLLRAVSRLGDDISLDVIQGVLHSECVERKSRASIFFDQAGRSRTKAWGRSRIVGFYGNASLEAAARGIPTIAHISRASFEGAKRGGHDIDEQCAIINTGLSSASIESTLKNWVAMRGDDRAQLSHRTRNWVESFHGAGVVARQLVEVYEGLRR